MVKCDESGLAWIINRNYFFYWILKNGPVSINGTGGICKFTIECNKNICVGVLGSVG